MSLWHADEPDGGTNPRGSIAENAQSPVPPPRPRPALLPLIGRLPAPVLATPAPGWPVLGAAAATWKSCRTRPAAMAGGSAGAPSASAGSAVRAEREESRRRTTSSRRRKGSRATEDAIRDGEKKRKARGVEAYVRACERGGREDQEKKGVEVVWGLVGIAFAFATLGCSNEQPGREGSCLPPFIASPLTSQVLTNLVL